MTDRRRYCWGLCAAALVLAALPCPAPGQQMKPSIGYLYPAGGQQGTKVRITVGGQQLRQPTDVFVSGKRVKASVIEYTGAIRSLQRQQEWLLLERLWELQEIQLKKAIPLGKDLRRIQAMRRKRGPWKKLDQKIDTSAYEMPKHPMLIDLEDRNLRELAHIQSYFLFPRNKLQDNRQIAEHMVIEVDISSRAEPGTRELRIRTGSGMTNPMRFKVGTQREVYEAEPNNSTAGELAVRIPFLAKILDVEALKLPVTINGQIMPGDVDRFRFRARKGQKLVIQAQARELIPYLADAVPGWFQAVLSLYDSDGNELAFADDNGINPDPTLTYRVPADGEYELAIRDAIYRGRQDFVYRILLAESSGKKPVPAADAVPSDLLPTDIVSLQSPDEKEPNNTPARALQVRMPSLRTGRIAGPGDVDMYRFRAMAGHTIVAEVYARRLGSQLDSLLRLYDASGKLLAWNDDRIQKEKHLHMDHVGLVTHHADSYLSAPIARSGTYYLQLSDARQHGGADYGYQLRISEPRPDFSLRVTPSSLTTRPGGIVPITVYALRQDGFDGEIKIALQRSSSSPELAGETIPAGANQVRMTVKAPAAAPRDPVSLTVTGRATINKRVVRHTAIPADNVMQAFLWRHLVPAKELAFVVKNQRWSVPEMEFADRGPVRLTGATAAPVHIRIPRQKAKRKNRHTLILKLDEPPQGISIVEEATKRNLRGLEFRLKADTSVATKPLKVNLIVQMIHEYSTNNKDGTKSKTRRVLAGYLPAIPIEYVP